MKVIEKYWKTYEFMILRFESEKEYQENFSKLQGEGWSLYGKISDYDYSFQRLARDAKLYKREEDGQIFK